MSSSAFSAALAAALLLGAGFAVGQAAYYHSTPVWMEAEEPDRNDRDAEGQFNCVQEAKSGAPTATCPWAETGAPWPSAGIRMLDAYVAATAWYRDPRNDPDDPTSLRIPVATGSPRRNTEGFVPEVILPGMTDLHAWWGTWNDLDRDGVISFLYATPSMPVADNEWVRMPLRSNTLSTFDIASYIEPGSRPGYGSWERPDAQRPDTYYYADDAYYAQESSGPIVHLDGSLLQPITVTTVTDALLAPSRDGKAYTATANSLVDVDLYPAIAPTPVAGVYASTLAPLANAVGSPSLGLIPGKGRLAPPTEAAATPLGPLVGSTVETAYAPYPREWADGSDSTGAGRRVEYATEYSGWVDLTIEYGPLGHPTGFDQLLVPRPGPMPGRGAGGGMAVAPGWASFALRTGVWYDANDDGIVGANPDPYASGARPLPDDYENNAGEFFAAPPLDGAGQAATTLSITLIPEGSWGSPGVIVHDPSGTVPVTSTSGGAACVANPISRRETCVTDPATYVVSDDRPITLKLFQYPSSHAPGHFRSAFVFFPFGSETSFKACTGPLPIAYTKAGLDVRETLADCDTFEALDVRSLLGGSFMPTPV